LRELEQDGGEKTARAEDFEDLFEFAGMRLLREFDDVADEFAGRKGDAHFRAERDLVVERLGDGVVEGAVERDFGNDAGSSIQGYIDEGYLPEAVRNYLCLLGWSPKDNREVISIEDVIAKFDLPDIGRANARFDRDKLFWINGEYMRAATLESLVPFAHKILNEHGIKTDGVDPAYFSSALAIVKEKIKLGRELPEWMGYFFTEDFAFDETASRKVFTPDGLGHLGALRDKLAALDAAKFTATDLEGEFKSLAAATGQKIGAYIHPARLATSGRPVGPSLYHLLEVLGKERVMNRIARAQKQFGAA